MKLIETAATPLSALGLSTRTYNALRRAGFSTIEEVALLSDEELMTVRSFGTGCLREFKDRLHAWLPTASPTPLPGLSEKPEAALAQIPCQALSAEISILRLPAPIHYALVQSGIRTTGQLLRLLADGEKALSFPSLMDGELDAVRASLNAWRHTIEHDLGIPLAVEPEKATVVSGPSTEQCDSADSMVLVTDASLDQWWEWLTKGLSEIQRAVLIRRHGLQTGDPLTLEQVGSLMGITRERVRQIEAKALRHIRSGVNKAKLDPWKDWFLYHIQGTGGLASLQEIGGWIIDDGVKYTEISPRGFAHILASSLVPDVQKIRGWNVYGPAPEVSPATVESFLVNVLRHHHTFMSWEDLWARFGQEWKAGKRPSESFVLACARHSKCIAQSPDGKWGLEKWQRGITDDLVAALRSLGRPAHYSELSEMIGESPRRVHALLGRQTDIFVWVRLRGTYGLAEWGLQPTLSYEDALAAILEQAGHPLTFEECLAELSTLRPYYEENSVLLALSTNPRFRAFPDKTYGLVEWTITEVADEDYRLMRLFNGIDESLTSKRPKPDLLQALDDVNDFFAQIKGKIDGVAK